MISPIQGLLPPFTAHECRQHHIFTGIEIFHKIVKLKNKTDMTIAISAQLLFTCSFYVQFLNCDGSVAGIVQSAYQIEKRALSAPALTSNDHSFSLFEGHRNTV